MQSSNVIAFYRKSLRLSFFDGVFYSLMVGLGESYFSAFSLAIGASEVLAGFTSVFPLCLGATLQLLSQPFVSKIKSRKMWVITCSTLQSLLLFFLALYSSKISIFGFLAISSLFFAFGLSASNSWNVWFGTLVPKRFRIAFFSTRSRFATLAVLIGLLFGGLILEQGRRSASVFFAFSILFGVGALFRMVSSTFMCFEKEKKEYIFRQVDSNWILLRSFFSHDSIAIVFYLFLHGLSVNLAGPYFTPYMLKKLHLSYDIYMVLIATAFLSRVLTYGRIQKLSHKKDPYSLVWMGALCIIPIPFLWTLSSNILVLVFFQILSGVAWAIHDQGIFLLLLDKFPSQKRAYVLSMINFINSMSVLLGCVLGGSILHNKGEVVATYFFLYQLSFFARFIPLAILPWVRKKLYHRTLSIEVIHLEYEEGEYPRSLRQNTR